MGICSIGLERLTLDEGTLELTKSTWTAWHISSVNAVLRLFFTSLTFQTQTLCIFVQLMYSFEEVEDIVRLRRVSWKIAEGW